MLFCGGLQLRAGWLIGATLCVRAAIDDGFETLCSDLRYVLYADLGCAGKVAGNLCCIKTHIVP
jgi:hypothetical protein